MLLTELQTVSETRLDLTSAALLSFPVREQDEGKKVVAALTSSFLSPHMPK